ncbi:phospholipid scramblase 2-like isoform X3 [Hemibagrus wyckioides]|nr:phospholipid scramblase 2-like isoform X3 [Hemibagrus wyckioides]
MNPVYGVDPHANPFSNGQLPLPPGTLPLQMTASQFAVMTLFKFSIFLPAGFVPPYVPVMMSFPPGYAPPQIPPIIPIPQRPPGCPPGLEYLTQVDQLLVHQKVELMEGRKEIYFISSLNSTSYAEVKLFFLSFLFFLTFSLQALLGWETNNQYVVKNSLGQQVWLATEESDFCTRMVCGPLRSFVMHLHDGVGQEVLTLTRPLKCGSCWFPCCLQELEVQAPPGTAIGYVMQDWHPYLPKFTIRDERKRAVLRIVGPFCDCNCCSDVIFKVISLDEASVIGRISKQWAGLDTEMFTDADHFGVQFPMNLEVKMKAVVLAACFLIDFMFFEHSPNHE